MTRRMQIEDLLDIVLPQQPALSPDGTRVAYVLGTSDAVADANRSSLWQVDTRTAEVRRLTRGIADAAPAWSPDGSRLLFVRHEPGPAQLWCLPADGGEAERLTDLPLGAGAGTWSPDGSRVVFCAPVDLEAGDTDDEAARRARARAPQASDRLDYREDGQGLLGSQRPHVHVLEVATGEVRRVTGGDWFVGAPAWSPDGTRIAFVGRSGADSDLTLHSVAHVVDSAVPEPEPLVVGPRDAYVVHAGWAPDGQSLLLVAATASPSHHARLLRVDLDTDLVTDLVAELDRNVMPGGPAYPGALPVAAPGTGRVLFCARDRGDTHVFEAPLAGGPSRPVLAGAGRGVSGLGVSASGRTAAVVLSTPTSYGEIATVDVTSGEVTVLTRHGAALAGVRTVEPQERTFVVSDGTEVHGWLLRDPAFRGPRPLLLDLHGGPHNAWSAAADAERVYHQVLVSRGWVVLLVNPRGSDGYGERFLTGALGAWGEADARDLLEPVDTLVAEGVVDPDRMTVAGYSYGGYLTCYLTSRDDRFAAAVTGGVISDLVSMAGTSDSGHLLSAHEIGVEPWRNPDRVAALSPLTRVDRVTTPTLILQGAEDTRCPVGQAEQWHTALRERGVPSRLVLYPGGSHLFPIDGPPSHRLDFNRRIVDWLEEHAVPVTRADPGAEESALVGRFRERLPAMVEEIGRLVSVESPSSDLGAVARSADEVAAVGTALLGIRPERVVVHGCTHLRWRLGTGPSRILLVGHHDTVWPLGSLRAHPFEVTDGRLRGPGCLDMKAGLVIAFQAVAALADASGVTLLITGDEEIGSPTSRELVEDEARGCEAALVLEAAADDGALKCERKGISCYEVHVTGRAAHAGLEPERGVNAALEQAHQMLAVAGLASPRWGTTVTPTVASAGTVANTVPARSVFAVDVRVTSEAEQQRVDRELRALRPVLPGAVVEVHGGPNRPPLPTDASEKLFARAEAVADDLGIGPVRAASVGGASDGNLTAGVGTATLDGLGAVGGGAHAEHEHVRVAELPRRTALLAALLDDLLGGGRLCRDTNPDRESGTGAPRQSRPGRLR
ncbi:MAG: beta-lactamase [Nocardioides sp.]|nr:beta-lactamase [Nocardioides sp.]